MNIGERILQLRLQNDMTQEELGKHLGVQKSVVSKYEKGRVENIKRKHIEKMARLFNVSPAYILCMERDPGTIIDGMFYPLPPADIKGKATTINDLSANNLMLIRAYNNAKNSKNPKDKAAADAIDRLLGIDGQDNG